MGDYGSMDLAGIEGDALMVYKLAGADPESPPSVAVLCRALLGSAPHLAPLAEEACLARVGAQWRVYVRHGTSPERAAWLVGHELAHWLYDQQGYPCDDHEAACDALGAALVTPRPAFAGAARRWGHRPTHLARAFRVPQSLALLRIGEVTGRPVVLVRRSPIARGEPFVWPDDERLFDAVRRPPPGVHPVRLAAEGRWGLMARDAAVA